MITKSIKTLFLTIFLAQLHSICEAQLTPINLETNGYGASWTWTTFENDTNPAVQIITNPFPGGINTSDNVIEFTALQAGQPWAGFESLHGGGIGTFTLDSTNSIVKLMVYKSVISDVGIKFVLPSTASTGELKVSNTVINQWEELTFDFTSQIGHPAMIGIDQIVIFPDFDLGGRTSDNICYIDNIIMGTPSTPINVKFEVQNTDSVPVYVFGDWNNWSNFPGTPMSLNSSTGNYEANVTLPPNTTIEYLFVNGVSTKEVLDSSWACTNGNPQFTNRLVTLGNADTTICSIWQSCASCIPLSIELFNSEQAQILVGEKFIRINHSAIQTIDQIKIYDLLGKTIYTSQGKLTTNKNIPVDLKSNTMHIIQIRIGDQFQTVKTLITN